MQGQSVEFDQMPNFAFEYKFIISIVKKSFYTSLYRLLLNQKQKQNNDMEKYKTLSRYEIFGK